MAREVAGMMGRTLWLLSLLLLIIGLCIGGWAVIAYGVYLLLVAV